MTLVSELGLLRVKLLAQEMVATEFNSRNSCEKKVANSSMILMKRHTPYNLPVTAYS